MYSLLFYLSGMTFIDLHSFNSGNLVVLLIDLLYSSLSKGGSFVLLLLMKNLVIFLYYFYYFVTSSLSMMIVFSDLTFLAFILKLAEDSMSFPAKQTVFLLAYSNFDLGSLSFKKRSNLGH